MFIFHLERFKHEFHSILEFYLNHKQFASTNITRRNIMHKYTRSILGNQEVSWETLLNKGRKPKQNPFLYSSREIPSPPRKTRTQEGA
jgi:hypothetical protein